MILVVGNINYDILFPLDRLPGPHEKVASEGALTGFGGSAANTAYWLAKLDTPVMLAGAVGNDALSEAHLVQLRAAGVQTRGVRMAAESTGVAVIFSLGREKRMVRALGANLSGRVDPDLLGESDLLYLSGVDTQTQKGYAALAQEKNIPMICGFHGARDKEVAGLAAGFILNSDEVRIVTGFEDHEEGIMALDSEIAAMTLPGGGCLVSRGNEFIKIPSPELEPVDRTGGGDAFAAGFLSGLEKGMDVEKCGKRGNELAAKVIMGMGARPEISIENFGLSIKK